MINEAVVWLFVVASGERQLVPVVMDDECNNVALRQPRSLIRFNAKRMAEMKFEIFTLFLTPGWSGTSSITHVKARLNLV